MHLDQHLRAVEHSFHCPDVPPPPSPEAPSRSLLSVLLYDHLPSVVSEGGGVIIVVEVIVAPNVRWTLEDDDTPDPVEL
ncbi:hypothetical protein ZIOFF_044122 [Zingiber officinale]|uniref:Uncharacterized protein n=1 Tax=Zingiber officinale TaxID=94328 RepID=A0A8J5FW73_ZINOF|nr:hypothetical protein ZIOFF_044122 [Zingiber officinale]